MRIFYFGTFDNFNLESSYLRAGKTLGHDTCTFDYIKVHKQIIPYGSLGSLINRVADVYTWVHQMNRKVIVEAVQYQPDLFLIFCNAKILPGSLLYLKSVLPHMRFVLIWPDPIHNIRVDMLASARFIDLFASYSSSLIPVLERAGFKYVEWVPLAGDLEIHPFNPDVSDADYEYDVSFVGSWRPEREEALVTLLNRFGKGIRLGVFGPGWDRYTQNKALRSIAISRALLGKNMATVFQKSRVNLNRIDVTNYPAANMRFFEIPTAGGTMLSSSCPEMEPDFPAMEAAMYFHDSDDLIKKTEILLQSDTASMRNHAYEKVRAAHTYIHRLKKIIDYL